MTLETRRQCRFNYPPLTPALHPVHSLQSLAVALNTRGTYRDYCNPPDSSLPSDGQEVGGSAEQIFYKGLQTFTLGLSHHVIKRQDILHLENVSRSVEKQHFMCFDHFLTKR